MERCDELDPIGVPDSTTLTRAAPGGTALDRAALRRGVVLARRLSQLTRAGSWSRLFPGSAHLGDPERATSLLHLLD
ncbi:hypothetical protein PWY87_07765 [Kribbella solani]|uniref:hypothetical protein n=1 Tax=Kribbella solani TaxID=236067 RepID=UPI0029B34923|nr:hypothetical protein [Kribbella solani]MDX2971949.1 hypothetical protein [Kribbella solani]MDX3001557.1 hypothetical protein [Kribbella solani]